MSLQLSDCKRPQSDEIEQVSLALGKRKRDDGERGGRTCDSLNALQSRSELNYGTFTMIEKRQVETAPPKYPSQVFLGDRAIMGCLPKK